MTLKQADGFFEKAIKLYAYGKYQEGLNLLLTFYNVYEKERLYTKHVELLITISSFYLQLGSNEKAGTVLEEGLAYGTRYLPLYDKNLGNLYYNYACAQEFLGEYSLCKQYLDRSLDIRTTNNNELARAETFNSLGQLYMRLTETDIAFQYFEKALSIRKEILGKNDLLVGAVYNNISLLKGKESDFFMAISYMKKALELELNSKNPLTLIKRCNNIAGLYLKVGDYCKQELRMKISTLNYA